LFIKIEQLQKENKGFPIL